MRRKMTVAWKSWKTFRCTLQKSAFSMQHATIFASFCSQFFLLNFVFQKKKWKVSFVFFQKFSMQCGKFSMLVIHDYMQSKTEFILFKDFFMITRTFRLEQFINCFNYVKIWLFKKFVTEFSWVHWNVREKNGLSWRKPSSQLLGKLSMSRKKRKSPILWV